LTAQIKEQATKAPRAYVPSHPAVKSSQPRYIALYWKSAFYVFAWPLVRTTLAIISWTLSSFRPFSNLQR